MNKTGIILTIIAVVGIGLTVFIILHRPANLLIRKTFTSITGLAVVKDAPFQEMAEKNKELSKQIPDLHKIIGNLQKANNDLTGELILARDQADVFRSELEKSKKELQGALQVLETMSTDEHIMLFDRQTEGVYATALIDFQGREVAGVEPGRIAHANMLIHERNAFEKENETLHKMVANLQGQIRRVESINANQVEIISMERREKAVLAEQLSNCEQARDEVMKDANKRAALGVGGVVVAVVVLVLSIM